MNILHRIRKNESLIYLLILVALSSALFFYKLGQLSLWDPDEPRYAETAKEMVRSGDWLVPRFNGKERFDKPVLFYWLIAAAYKAFGISEFTARLWPAIFGLLGVILVYLLGQKMFSPKVGLFSGLILATNIQYVTVSRLAITDMALTFFLELAFFSFWFGYQSKARLKKNLFYLIFYISIALAALTKGPVALVFAGFIVILFLIINKDLKVLKEMQIFLGAAVFCLIALPWYIIIIQQYGRVYVDYFFLKHNIARFATHELKHPGPFVYYLPVLYLGLFPWSAFLFSSIWCLGTDKFNFLNAQKKQLSFLFIWFFTIFIFFSIAKAKLPTYIMSLYFPAALLLGRFLGLVVENKESAAVKKHINVSLVQLFIMFLSMAVALFIVVKINSPQSILLTSFMNIWLFLGLVFILFLFRAGRFLSAFVSLSAVIAVFTILFLSQIAPRAAEVRSLREAGQKVFSLTKGQGSVFSYRFLKPSSVFYCDQNIKRLESKAEFIEVLNKPQRIFCWIDSDDEYYEEVKDLIKNKAWVIAQTSTKLVISNKP